MQLNWKPEYHVPNLTSEQVEEAHHQQQSPRRQAAQSNKGNIYPKKVFNIPSTRRSKIMKENGITISEQQRSQKMATITRNARKKTIKSNLEWDEKIENYKRWLTCYQEQVIDYPKPQSS